MTFRTGLTAKSLGVVCSAAAYFSEETLALLPKAVLATCYSSVAGGRSMGELLYLKTGVSSVLMTGEKLEGDLKDSYAIKKLYTTDTQIKKITVIIEEG